MARSALQEKPAGVAKAEARTSIVLDERLVAQVKHLSGARTTREAVQLALDSSVWIDFLRGGQAVETLFLRASLKRGDPVWLAAPILQEVLQGADSQQRFDKWDRALGELPMVRDADLRGLARASARLYVRCRWQGAPPGALMMAARLDRRGDPERS